MDVKQGEREREKSAELELGIMHFEILLGLIIRA